MERLTKRDTDGQAMMDCEKCKADWTGKHGKPMVDCTALYCRNRLKDRLAAYEDTRLTPERCAEFARADAEGRYIVMRDAEQEGVARLRELAEADKDGRVAVLPRWKNEEERLERRRLMQIMADGAIARLMMGNPLKEENGPDIAELRVVNTEEAMRDE